MKAKPENKLKVFTYSDAVNYVSFKTVLPEPKNKAHQYTRDSVNRLNKRRCEDNWKYRLILFGSVSLLLLITYLLAELTNG